jgi:hypothetical protein
MEAVTAFLDEADVSYRIVAGVTPHERSTKAGRSVEVAA